jgi:hypothetical protein
MPAPLALVGAIAGVIGFFFKESIEAEVGRIAAQSALDEMGIPLDLSGPVTHETITAAICEGPLRGEVTFSNFFDKDAVKADLRRIAVERAGQAFGYEGGMGVDAVRERIVGEILDEITEQIEAGAGVYLDAARGLSKLDAVVILPKDASDWNKPVDFSPAGIKNREYQAAYRANHTKKWVPR